MHKNKMLLIPVFKDCLAVSQDGSNGLFYSFIEAFMSAMYWWISMH
jgi:hypothetical protein